MEAKPNPKILFKRHFLNEVIHLVYALNRVEHLMHFDNTATVQCGRDDLKRQLDTYTQPECTSPWRKRVNQCRRQLFREPQSARKQKRPRRNACFGVTEVIHIKPLRHLIPRTHIRRGFLAPVRRISLYNMLREAIDDMKNRSQESPMAQKMQGSWPTWIPIPLRG